MAIVLKTAPVDPPVSNDDWTRTQELITMLFLGNNGPILRVVGGNIVKGSVFQIGGAIYYADSDTAISGVESDYVKITPAGATASASYVADLSGVSWNDEYNGYVDGSGNLYLFDEAKEAYRESIIPRTALGSAPMYIKNYIHGIWTTSKSAADNYWHSVCYGNGLFVAVAISGTGNRVMTSPDGINWTIQTSAEDNFWRSVCYGNGLFVAVAASGTGNRVMTSPDGINWDIRPSAADNYWHSVCYGNGLFVAVAISGTGNRVMTSPDGINWTIQTSAEDNGWRSVCYGNGLFVAVAASGTGNRVMTSPDGINWTIQTSAADNYWRSVCYGNGLFVAVAGTGTGNRVMKALAPPA